MTIQNFCLEKVNEKNGTMSVRAIKKKENQSRRPYNKKQQQPPYFPQQYPSNQTNLRPRAKSQPNLSALNDTNLICAHSKSLDTFPFQSVTYQFDNLIDAKSEICLQTISVHKTMESERVHDFAQASHASNQFRRMSERSNITTSQSELQNRGFADTSNVRIPIIGYEVMEERARFTVYKLRVENPFRNDCWLVLRRYTDFVRLNNKLKTMIPNLNLTLPRKKIFGDNFASVFLDNRAQGLQIFVNSIMGNDRLKNLQVVKDFFCLDDPPTYSESMEECRAVFEAQEETITHLKIQLRSKETSIESLEQKLAIAIQEKEAMQKAVRNSYENCSKCSKDIENFLQETHIDSNKKSDLPITTNKL